tara:strand:+ start:7569 stop:10007 length:2439 start_codon:yes stop_codon:yes gene_type:complete
MSLFGFSREDIARQLSDFAKKDLIANYPDGASVPPGFAEFTAGRQTGVDPELYLYYSDNSSGPIPAAQRLESDENPNDYKWECGVTELPQRVYKPRIRNDQQYGQVGQFVDAVRVKTVHDAGAGNYADGRAYVYNPWGRPIPANEIGICALIGGVLFALQRPPVRRVRFRLYTGFNDTGVATAKVLDAWGDDNLYYGEPITVTDPRKLFAHAVGETQLQDLHDQNPDMNDMLHAGGSVGYAVETYQIRPEDESNPFDCAAECDGICYPRWEVEQCTQQANKMVVHIDEYDAMPRGDEIDAPSLRVYPESYQYGFASQWPYVDYPTNLEVIAPETPSGTAEYRVTAHNSQRFSAMTGWAIVERVDYPSRLQNAENRCVPYTGGLGTRNTEWHIVAVERPIARWICAVWNQSNTTWSYDGSWFEGEEPSAYFQDPNETGENINDHISTHPCLPIDCLKNGSKAFCFWDPNDQKYYAFATESAMYGKAVNYEVVGKKDSQNHQLMEFASGCCLTYKTNQHIKVFGHNESCEASTQSHVICPEFVDLPVVTSVSRPTDSIGCNEDYLNVTKAVAKVCSVEADDPEVVEICCEPCGCCCTDDGPIEGVTQSECAEMGGTFLEGQACPPCSDCQDCPTQFEFQGFELSWSNVPDAQGNQFNGEMVNFSLGAAAGCCVNFTATLTSQNPQINPQVVTGTLCMSTADGNCPQAAFQVNVTWSQATYANVDLPTVLCGGQLTDCIDTFGKSSSGVVPDLPNQTAGTWDEVDVVTGYCTCDDSAGDNQGGGGGGGGGGGEGGGGGGEGDPNEGGEDPNQGGP